MNDVVSVIVPIFNVESYLLQCINSVLNQTYHDLDVILIDDGGNDKCGEICDRVALSDKRICVIHQCNGGLSSARNTGTAFAKGEYIFYLDGDDWMELSSIDYLKRKQKEYQSDIVISSYYYDYPDTVFAADFKFEKEQRLTCKEAITALVNGRIQNFAWGKLIKTEYAKEFLFPVGKLYEDHFWCHYIVGEATSIVVTDYPTVHYRQRAASISYQPTIKILDRVEGYKKRKQYLEEKYPDTVPEFMKNVGSSLCGIAWSTRKLSNAQRALAREKLIQSCKELDVFRYAAESDRAMLKAYAGNFGVYLLRCYIRKIKKAVIRRLRIL